MFAILSTVGRDFEMDWEAALKANFDNNLPLGPTTFFFDSLVPTEIKANLEFRKKILDLCYSDEGIAREIRMICERDVLFEMATFGWTLAIKQASHNPVQPFIPYPFQQRIIPQIEAAIGVEDVSIPKSRDMGASWCCLVAMEHRWRYMPNQSFLLASRKRSEEHTSELQSRG